MISKEDELKNYRIFISYSHEDQKIADKVEVLLKKIGLTIMWDKKFAFGYGFHEQIKTFIAHAHIFLPIITESSSKRGWVHQEIGYAMALNVPVLPIAVEGALPGEMIQQLHAIKTDKALSKLDSHLTKSVFENLVRGYKDQQFAIYQSAYLTEDRAIFMAEFANEVLSMGYTGLVRQKGALSSFHIPDKIKSHQAWKERYGPYPKSEFHCRGQRKERLTLEQHAREAGCKLIIDPSLKYEQYGPKARKVRLETLVEFLDSMPDEKVQVAINKEMELAENLIIVGDWFAAESVAGNIGRGYRQTIFTRHAPSMQSRIEVFDQEFDSILESAEWDAKNSRVKAIYALQEIIGTIKV